ncbi:hypothetical protein Pmani_010835 [Petrolisthes manimaculis]|uniref:Uncharacterized protein n=1 Tax=Petrolisthes manimaculis TaxID=1843537 RepID=A0AAE1Q0R6_9EUCA|nr:hypothetical protein Pmani_010835 [Petrolisthes manimaculis]
MGGVKNCVKARIKNADKARECLKKKRVEDERKREEEARLATNTAGTSGDTSTTPPPQFQVLCRGNGIYKVIKRMHL